jgi:hypothetical protein
MSTTDLSKTAQTLVADGRGILAADETVLTVTRRLAALSIESTREIRRAYREMFFTTPDFFSASSCRMRRSTRRYTRRSADPAGIVPGATVWRLWADSPSMERESVLV